MATSSPVYKITVSLLLICFLGCKEKKETNTDDITTTEKKPLHQGMHDALTLYASFDDDVTADFAKGDKNLYTVPSREKLDSAQAGLHKPDISIAKDEGKYGDALRYTESSDGNIYYRSAQNIAYNEKDWSGAISFWLSLDPESDLEPGYCDPIQITDVNYNDAAIWVDFTKENPRDFRLGVIGDRDVWNPNPEGPDNENDDFNEQLVPVKNPPFDSGKWTHILINYSNLNTDDGMVSLYLNGELQGTRTDITDPFTWDLEKSNIYLGLGYIGLMDELSIFDRDLSDDEIQELYSLEEGVGTILNNG